ncbi:MAG: prephenate dehydratase [Desulfovibrio sp.]|nr:prephenate dehydratase [Desulfovibrio sp.]
MSDNEAPARTSAERLALIRREIEKVDSALLGLLGSRAELSREVGRIKSGEPGIIFKPLREREVLDRLVGLKPASLPEEHLRSIWREILSSSRALQRPQNVAYLGPEGTFSYFAGVEYLGHSADFHPCRDIHQIFEEVHSGGCELGVVPLENSLQGTVGVSFDLFLRFEVFIQAELFSRISHCFLSHAPSLANVRIIYSHPQPLAQCGGWLRAHVPDAALVPVESTAAAACRAAEDDASAAIGHIKLADLHGLNILARRIEDTPNNWTRFVIIGPKSTAQDTFVAPGTGRAADKTSVLFTLPDRSGALSSVLDLLAANMINMRKLESRPLLGQAWKYVFFADVECDLRQPRYEPLVEKLHETCHSFRILGSYAAGPELDRMTIDSGADAETDRRNER